MNLDREKAEDLLNDIWADSRAIRFTIDEWVDRLEGCVGPDPRLARIAALPDDWQRRADRAWRNGDYETGSALVNLAQEVRAVLGGGPA